MSGESARDPYLGMWKTIRDETDSRQPLYFCLGLVLEASATAIRVQADGQELDGDDLLINDQLRAEFSEEAEVSMHSPVGMSGRLTGGAEPCANGSHSYFDVTGYNGAITAAKTVYKPKYRLRAGDQVLLIPSQDRQTYYLICKVVPYASVPTH